MASISAHSFNLRQISIAPGIRYFILEMPGKNYRVTVFDGGAYLASVSRRLFRPTPLPAKFAFAMYLSLINQGKLK